MVQLILLSFSASVKVVTQSCNCQVPFKRALALKRLSHRNFYNKCIIFNHVNNWLNKVFQFNSIQNPSTIVFHDWKMTP